MSNATKKKIDREIEKLLLPRLKLIGGILVVFSLIAFSYTFFVDQAEKLPQELIEHPKELDVGLNIDSSPESKDPLNFFIVSAIFLAVGTTCFFISKKKSF